MPSSQRPTVAALEAPLKEQEEDASQTVSSLAKSAIPTSSPSSLHHPPFPEPSSAASATTRSSSTSSPSPEASNFPRALPASPTNRQRPPLPPLGKTHGKPGIERERTKVPAFEYRFSNHHEPDGILPIFTETVPHLP
ncbi:uncharacterized protein LTHEOB_2901 [Lasiodiplodia theobromae]|uniref:Uncharacterized protein n=1 Tax=Lasiodiplodia theobromae TaxID=45133 RepID=A0A5N5D0A9_9PEZI|nr:uncharacterized protein LTHEOB_2901 [Lasiodiplodia theobromae]KAB2571031.1 hypothetical protein DBV05_g10280 [Lasiodiplodia theobromae]KAF4534926.1 hypothetical protein LTHEOB_2901 [Lasiodiplodia theobromae]